MDSTHGFFSILSDYISSSQTYFAYTYCDSINYFSCEFVIAKNYKSSATLLVTHKGADPVTGMILPAQLSASYMATQLDVIKVPGLH